MAAKKKTIDDLAQEYCAGCLNEELRAYGILCFKAGYSAGRRSRIEESASLQSVEESALSRIPDDGWRSLMSEWLNHKRSIKKRYTRSSSIIGCYEELRTYTSGDLSLATSLVRRSINANYQGIAYPQQSPSLSGTDRTTSPSFRPGASSDRRTEVQSLSRLAVAGAGALASLMPGSEPE